MTGSLLGTPSYMSPEQAKGVVSALDGRSDLFSVGCVLYEMLAGRKAFSGESITALIFKIVAEEPPDLHELARDVPEAMLRIVAKCLAKSPDARYQSGRELADALLTFTRPGAVPTVRQAEVETTVIPAASSTPPPSGPAAQTLQGKASTIAAPATSKQDAPTIASPRRPPPPPVSSPPPRPLAPAPARRTGGGAGLLIGLGGLGLVTVALAAAAAWYFFLRAPAETPTAAALGEGPGAMTGEVGGPDSTGPGAAPPGGLPTAAPPPSGSEAAATAAPPAPSPAAGATRAAAPPAVASPAAPVAPPPRQADAAPAPSFLDEEPPPTDGREAGEQLAGKYRSGQGGTTSGPYGATARYRARPRSPERQAPLERPAVGTLRHIVNAQEAFHRRNGRYGTFTELARAQTLFLDVPHDGGSFQRAGYRFELALGGDGFKVTAMPLGPGPRPFHADDSGYILAGNE
jgi:hypothetical protein